MKVCIGWDRLGWFWYPPRERGGADEHEPLREAEKSKVRALTYDGILSLAAWHGHQVDNAGWKQKLLMWNWQWISLDRYPGWESEHGSPPWCKIEHVNKPDSWPGGKLVTTREGTPSSSDVANKWDDVAQAQFYTRDLSYDHSCSVGNGEPYMSLWWFRTAAERDRFLAWLAETMPTIKILCRSAADLPPEQQAG